MEIFPSLISSDILNLEKTIKLLEPHCDGFHIDVMDDHFVPNLTWGPSFVNAIAKVSNLPLHVHLMVENPEQWVDRIELSSADIFIFHIELFLESPQLAKKLINDVKKKKCKVGIAINPYTEVEVVFELLQDVDHLLIMSVEPGFSGQEFIHDVVEKIDPVLEIRRDGDLDFTIGMDGGIDKGNIAMLADRGIDQIGVASAIFKQKDWVKALGELYSV